MNPTTLTSIRKANGYTMRAMAEHLQISRDTWRAYEKGKRPIPKWLALAMTAVYYKIEIIDIILPFDKKLTTISQKIKSLD
jgi:transcriptional regulator with XRE-family HTH domain